MHTHLGLLFLFDELPFLSLLILFILRSDLSDTNMVMSVLPCLLLHGVFLFYLFSECVSSRYHTLGLAFLSNYKISAF